jgi:hypothetical protein
MSKTAYTEIAQIDMLTGNIALVTMNNGAEVDLEAAKQLVRTMESLTDSTNLFKAALFDISGLTYMQAEARDYLASGEDICGVPVGVALISYSFMGKTIGKMFINMCEISEAYPVEYFESPIRAEHWIRTRLKEAQILGDDRKKVA